MTALAGSYKLASPDVVLDFEMIDSEQARAIVHGPRTVWATTRVPLSSSSPDVTAAYEALCAWRDYQVAMQAVGK